MCCSWEAAGNLIANVAAVREWISAVSLALVLCALMILLFLNSDPSYVFPGTSRTERGKGKDCVHTLFGGKPPYILL